MTNNNEPKQPPRYDVARYDGDARYTDDTSPDSESGSTTANNEKEIEKCPAT